MKKILLFFYGESFRYGGQFTRHRNYNTEGVNRQIIATNSHLKLKNHIENKFKTHVDIGFVSYKNNYELNNLLINKYKPQMFYFHNQLLRNEGELLIDISCRFKKEIIENNYDNILFIRLDFYLKDYFLQTLNFDDTIKCGFIDSGHNFGKNRCINDYLNKSLIDTCKQHDGGKHFLVCHCICQIPKRFYNLLFDTKFLRYHHGLFSHLVIKNNIKINDLSFFVNTGHLCNSNVGWNPLFVNCGGGELDNMGADQNSYLYYDPNSDTIKSDKNKYNYVFDNEFTEKLKNI